MPTIPSTEEKPKHRGFATMDREKQREIASKGGKAAHAQGRAHEFSADEARTAGRKGGEVVSQDKKHMAEIGREGGMARGRRERERQATRKGAASGPGSGEVSAPPSDLDVKAG